MRANRAIKHLLRSTGSAEITMSRASTRNLDLPRTLQVQHGLWADVGFLLCGSQGLRITPCDTTHWVHSLI